MPLHLGRYGASPDVPGGGTQVDEIEAIGIDEAGGLWIRPATKQLPYIYREGAEVGWDASLLRLTSPKPRVWSHVQWFEQIVKAARGQGVALTLVASTSWVNLDENLQQAIIARATSA